MAVHSAKRPAGRQTQRHPAIVLIAFVVAVLVCGWLIKRGGFDAPQQSESVEVAGAFQRSEELPWPESPYLNARPGVEYIGSESCRDCHSDAFATYSRTAHSGSLRQIAPEAEPPDAEFGHAASRRRYKVYRDGSELRHREVLLLPGGEEEVSHDHALDYTIGSGRFGHTYFADIAGFLIQSPVTWRTLQENWDMSPGYERAGHMSFRRFVTDGCLFCHAGRVSRQEGNTTRLAFHEMAIGCERCHGPGSLHVARHRSGSWTAAEDDLTIVNPGRLAQDKQEAVCAQCHLNTDAHALVRGRRMDDYRPGLPLDQFRVDFWLHEPEEGMSVVGHHAQLHQSRCYAASDGMGCLTCHDPHDDVPPDERVAHFRSTCLSCHSQKGCGVPEPERMRQAANDCIQCHMPKAATEVPHVAFTHHRIAIHSPATTEQPSQTSDLTTGELIPIDELDLPEVERIRLRGLAHFAQFRGHGAGPTGEHHRRRASQLLNEALQRGSGDAEVRSALANLAWQERDAEKASTLAQSVVAESDSATREWVDAASVLAEIAFARQDFVRARNLYEQLAQARYNARYWFYLGLCEQNCEDTEAAVRALEKSLEIDPVQTGAHELLAILYSLNGNNRSERHHRQMSRRISAFLQQFEGNSPPASPESAHSGQ